MYSSRTSEIVMFPQAVYGISYYNDATGVYHFTMDGSNISTLVSSNTGCFVRSQQFATLLEAYQAKTGHPCLLEGDTPDLTPAVVEFQPGHYGVLLPRRQNTIVYYELAANEHAEARVYTSLRSAFAALEALI